jgi:hypothetical protein
MCARHRATDGRTTTGQTAARPGALAEEEAALLRSAEAATKKAQPWETLAALCNRGGQLERAVETLDGAAERNKSNVSLHHLTFCFAKLSEPARRRHDRMWHAAVDLLPRTARRARSGLR